MALDSISISVTDGCFQDCSYCFVKQDDRLRGPGAARWMSAKCFASTLSSQQFQGITNLLVTGGEPIQESALPQLAAYLDATANHDIQGVWIATSGGALEKALPLLREHRKRIRLRLSVVFGEKGITLKNGKSFENVAHTMNENQIPFATVSTVEKDDVKHLQPGFHAVFRFSPLFHSCNIAIGHPAIVKRFGKENALAVIMDVVTFMHEHPGVLIRFEHPVFGLLLQGLGAAVDNCGCMAQAGTFLSVRVDGTVTPCSVYAAGVPWRVAPHCKTCLFRPRCGGCPADASLWKTALQHDPWCQELDLWRPVNPDQPANGDVLEAEIDKALNKIIGSLFPLSFLMPPQQPNQHT